eukprot:NODE_7402_length_1582_cov_4.611684.p1 GENE.NODE_7402_length_1582_cov_4.611684~~NODE_7402_length_1582_cov_4.611684.p1  ORF type:complete len:457 (-),score=117.25 NODE_7402_length_1582_cov_4.611684:211-1428(-)
MAYADRAQALTTRAEQELPDASSTPEAANAKRRELFVDYAALWNDAEGAQDDATLEVLRALRPKLRLMTRRSGGIWKLIRMVLMYSYIITGLVPLMVFSLLRVFNRPLLAIGVPVGMRPLDFLQTFWTWSVAAAMGIKVVEDPETKNAWDGCNAGIVVYNHASFSDPVAVSLSCHWYRPSFLSKKTIMMVPFLGWSAYMHGHVPINRGNREKAMATMNKAIGGRLRRGVSVAIAPEGTRSTDGHLILPFKKGAFHTQAQVHQPFLPLVVYGAHAAWPPKTMCPASHWWNEGELRIVRLPPQMPVEETAAGAAAANAAPPTEEARMKLQRAFSEHLSKEKHLGPRPIALRVKLANLGVLVAYGTFTAGTIWLIRLGIVSLHLSAGTIIGLGILVSVAVAAAIEVFV